MGPIKDYWSILESASFSLPNLHFVTDLGTLTLSEIRLSLKTWEKLELKEYPKYDFHIAVLLQQLDIRISFSRRQGITFYIVRKDDDAVREQLSAFPPGLFLLPLTADDYVISIGGSGQPRGDIYFRMPYNASHFFQSG